MLFWWPLGRATEYELRLQHCPGAWSAEFFFFMVKRCEYCSVSNGAEMCHNKINTKLDYHRYCLISHCLLFVAWAHWWKFQHWWRASLNTPMPCWCCSCAMLMSITWQFWFGKWSCTSCKDHVYLQLCFQLPSCLGRHMEDSNYLGLGRPLTDFMYNLILSLTDPVYGFQRNDHLHSQITISLVLC